MGQRKIWKKYGKTIFNSISPGFMTGYAAASLFAITKLGDLKAGEHPNMLQDEIQEIYYEKLPYVILEAILLFLCVSILVSIITLIIFFKVSHDINLFSIILSKRKDK